MDFRATKALPIVTDCGDSQRRRRRAHSFSSSLLDAICQSMELDEDDCSQRHFDDVHDRPPVSSHNHLKVKISKQQRTKPSDHTQVTSFRQEKKPNEGRRHAQCPSSSSISNFSYSESSSTLGPLSTSGSGYGGYTSTSSSSSCFSTCSKKSREERMSSMKDKMTKAKMRAIKFCSELKNARSNPISPRCRLATYLNSLFNNSKKQQNKTSSPKPVPAVVVVAPPKQETYSSKPTSITNSSSQSQIVKPPYSGQAGPMQRREVFMRCREKIVRGLKMREFIESAKMDEEKDDDDAESYASSDLFELETLIVGAGEELPVFETTDDIKINRAIANAFSM